MVNDQEPRYQLVDSNGNVVGSLFQNADGNVEIQDETGTGSVFGPNGIVTPAIDAESVSTEEATIGGQKSDYHLELLNDGDTDAGSADKITVTGLSNGDVILVDFDGRISANGSLEAIINDSTGGHAFVTRTGSTLASQTEETWKLIDNGSGEEVPSDGVWRVSSPRFGRNTIHGNGAVARQAYQPILVEGHQDTTSDWDSLAIDTSAVSDGTVEVYSA